MADSSPAAVQTPVAMSLPASSLPTRVVALRPVAGSPDQDVRRSRDRVRS